MESTTTTTAGNGTTPPRGTVTTDTELVAMTRIGKLLNALDDTARSRVVRYIAEKYEADLGETL